MPWLSTRQSPSAFNIYPVTIQKMVIELILVTRVKQVLSCPEWTMYILLT